MTQIQIISDTITLYLKDAFIIRKKLFNHLKPTPYGCNFFIYYFIFFVKVCALARNFLFFRKKDITII